MTPEFALQAVAHFWLMPFDNWRRGVDALMVRFA